MGESLPSPSSSYNQEGSPKPTTTRSGLTLVLPSLKTLKAAKVAKKSQRSTPSLQSTSFDVEASEKKIPRPVKLKPLKEVLTKLIQQIKKKDDYAFFLEPVDLNQVPGYLDVIKRPMDFGTMTNKVNRGKYRSLEDFANDLKLVTANSKAFNPPGSIYHTEADRIEAWALDHIAKATSTVIQYETDWNIDIEKDDDAAVNVDDDDEYPPASVQTEDAEVNGRSPSVASQVQQNTGRRGPRGPYKKSVPSTTVSESIDNEGRLPGSKDGLGAFPPCSDWARTTVALKLKGKRYKTKKERLRFEKEGPPYLPDGSLNYMEMEDPFSVLSVLVPDPPSRPHLTSVYPPLSIPHALPQPLQSQTQSSSETSTPQPETAQALTSFPSTISLPLHYDPLSSINIELPATNAYPRRRHWNIVRNPIGRKNKEGGDDNETDDPPWQTAREVHPVDFGSFAVLAAALSEEMKRHGVTPGALRGGEEEKAMIDAIRDSLDVEDAEQKLVPGENSSSVNADGLDSSAEEFFTSQRAAEAEEYIRDMVYGGPEGLAYVRSLAEFVTLDRPEASLPSLDGPSELGLKMPLVEYVQKLVDELTEGRHSLLRETAEQLSIQSHDPGQLQAESIVAAQTARTLQHAPEAMTALQALLQLKLQKIDMSALINKPEELFLSEEEWAGKGLRKKQGSKKPEIAEEEAAFPSNQPTDDAMDGEREEVEKSWMDVDTDINSIGKKDRSNSFEMESPEELAEVLAYVAGLIDQLNQRLKGGVALSSPDSPKAVHQGPAAMSDGVCGDAEVDKSGKALEGSGGPSGKESGAPKTMITTTENPALRNLRLNLLALAKRAPLDTIARLPLELVPEHIRHYIPTFDSTSTSPAAASSLGSAAGAPT